MAKAGHRHGKRPPVLEHRAGGPPRAWARAPHAVTRPLEPHAAAALGPALARAAALRFPIARAAALRTRAAHYRRRLFLLEQ